MGTRRVGAIVSVFDDLKIESEGGPGGDSDDMLAEEPVQSYV